MPYVEVSRGVELFYEIEHSGMSEAEWGGKPWLMVMHPLLMDGSYVRALTGTGPIAGRFNRIVLDARHHGRSRRTGQQLLPPPPDERHGLDLFSLAADLALALRRLNIPPVHALATHSWAAEVLLRIAALFPFVINSLCLCSPPPPIVEDFLGRAFHECFKSVADPKSVEDWDEGVGAVQWFNFGEPSFVDCDILDEWAGVLIRRFPPSRAADCFLCVWPFLGACQVSKPDDIPDSLRSQLKAPILILRGTNDVIFTEAGCRARLDEFPRHEHSAFKAIQDAPLLCCRTHPTEVATAYMEWVEPLLDRADEAERREKQDQMKDERCWKRCLETLALSCRPSSSSSSSDEDDQGASISRRDPLESDSYNRNSAQEIRDFHQLLTQLSLDQVKTFSLFGGGSSELWDGASFDDTVPWRFSSRFDAARLAMSEPVLQRDTCGTPSTTTSTTVSTTHSTPYHMDDNDSDYSLSEDALKRPVVQINTSVEVCYHDMVDL